MMTEMAKMLAIYVGGAWITRLGPCVGDCKEGVIPDSKTEIKGFWYLKPIVIVSDWKLRF